MRLKNLELNGFKSFAAKAVLEFESPIVSIVGPNGSGKSNVVEAIRYVLGEQSMKSMRGKTGTDLIFKGSKSLPKGSRASVSISFNNQDKIFKLENDSGEEINLNFDSINISRQVFSDGSSKYLLNDTEVRLRDIHNLLASVKIGSSGHHIISQGEADRVLNANSKERKEMVEDALGLKIYQYKIKESEKKLERTLDNMKEVSMLRRENAPHLNFLKKQVEKFEKVRELQAELKLLYLEYLKYESIYLEKEKQNLSIEREKIKRELKELEEKIGRSEEGNFAGRNKKIEELSTEEKKLNEIRNLKNEMERKLGRIEGMIEGEERRLEKGSVEINISPEEVNHFVEEMKRDIDEAFKKESILEIRPILERIRSVLRAFDKNKNESERNKNISEINNLKDTKDKIEVEIVGLDHKEKEALLKIEELKKLINREMEALHDLEREKFSLKVKYQELSSTLELIVIKETNLKNRTQSFEIEIKEGVALLGGEILSYKDYKIDQSDNLVVDQNMEAHQVDLKKKIERIKIKLEDGGVGSGEDILKEFKEVSDRDQFLAKEMEDLTKSIESLKTLISDLKEKIDIEFKEGVKKINNEFQEFFSILFGGGTALLSIVVENKKKRNVPEELEDEIKEEDEEIIFEQGIEISVSLPHKKVRELQALSGGERSLTSIALLFAMSQVNPPPFLVLDETDAALDEANSRKYGDMLEKLAHHSQLIVVTHNRETMSRAGVLYGVTIGSNGASKLLSIKFDEAAQIAK